MELTEKFGVRWTVNEIGSALSAMGCYDGLNESIRETYPDYDPQVG